MNRTEKQEMVKQLEAIFDNSGSVVMTAYTSMTVAEMTDLRAKLREKGAAIRIVKNRLARIALNDRPFASAEAMLTGPVAIAYGEDLVSAPKVVVEFAKTHESFSVIGGFMGEDVFDSAGIESLSKLPTREELIGMVGQRLLGQASQVGQRLTSPGAALAGAIQVIEQKAAA